MWTLQNKLRYLLSIAPDIDPLYVNRVVAGWHRELRGVASAGAVLRLSERDYADYAYVYYVATPEDERVMVGRQFYDEEPTFLYDRANDWVFDKEILSGIIQRPEESPNAAPSASDGQTPTD